ncbi:hypothetical protein PAXRUDRAFT_34047 [Paxillus rubicundulus Ve08.2h10]|uniref:Unplaced genomic scaffold scaffold_360, whole genome shotgun sequence n=1 Tax=Paxillus rubicundulus Ve08.2h10 TaxID=930991 RepID=A0A0D0D927_9AGAM|nr:hypothetical protein PAXRUDRAFT_34047 [Paxillus rubicundulus Ve08.2h10]
MSIPSAIHPAFAFVHTVWSSILRLVRSFIGLFSSNDRSPEATCTLPKTHPRKAELLVPQASLDLRSSIVTQRNLTVFTSFSPYGGPGRKASGHNDVPTNPLTPVFQHSILRRALSGVPIDGNDDAELGLSTAITPITAHICDQPQVSAALAMRPRAMSPDTPSPIYDCSMSPLFMMPLTPPDRCYFPGLSSANDYLYREPWPINNTTDRNKPRKLPSSPLKASFGNDSPFPESMIRTWDSPGRWAPVQIWTSTPRKMSPMHETGLGSFDAPMFGTVQSLLADTPSRGTAPRPCIVPIYDDASTTSSACSLLDISVHPYGPDADDPTHTALNTPVLVNENQSHGQGATQPETKAGTSFPRVSTWDRHAARVTDKPDGSQSPFHSTEWYEASAYVSSPIAMLSPPDACPPLSVSESEAESAFGCEAKLPLSGVHLTLFTSKPRMGNDRLPTPAPSVLPFGSDVRTRGHVRSNSDPGVLVKPCGGRNQCVGSPRHNHDFQKGKTAEPSHDAGSSLFGNLVVGGGFVGQVGSQGGVGVSVPAVA